jgi:threonine dehydratase
MQPWPITLEEVLAAARRIRPYLPPTPLRRYATLDAAIGQGIQVYVKHENHNPTGAFKARNGMAVMTALSAEEKTRGVVAATRGNHGLGLAWAGALLGVPVIACVPVDNNPEKNEGMRAFGATVIESGEDYDAAAAVAHLKVKTDGLRMVHAANDPLVIAGAATLTLEILQELPEVDAMVIAVGGGAMAAGALTVVRALKPSVEVYGVQAERASAIHDSWHSGRPVSKETADTFADGLATRNVYELTFGALRQGLKGFVTAPEAELAAAIRLIIHCTHNLAEGAGAAGLAGLMALRETLHGKKVAVILSGGNVDQATLRKVVNHEI